MKADINKLKHFGINTVNITYNEKTRIINEIANNAVMEDYWETTAKEDISPKEQALFVSLLNSYNLFFWAFQDYGTNNPITKLLDPEEWSKFKTANTQTLSAYSSIQSIIEDIYNSTKRDIGYKTGYTELQEIKADTISKRNLSRKTMQVLDSLEQDLFRSLEWFLLEAELEDKSNQDILDDLETFIDDFPLINKDDISTHTLNHRLLAIVYAGLASAKNQAILNTYMSMGALEFDIETAGDMKVCQGCLDKAKGSPYSVEDENVELPPFHDHCRCYPVIRAGTELYNPRELERYYDLVYGGMIELQ